ncbi:MAG: MepB family protein [Bacteroidia bacterium]|nr:MepB family protein [Bacteroidia bacterium]
MTTNTLLYDDLNVVKEMVYDHCGFALTNLKVNTESKEYGACSFELNGLKIEHRISKITATKTGQFVTIWKRSKNGITEPFNSSDDVDFIAITARSGHNLGQFIFPKSVLVEKGIITHKAKDGKRGIRVYPKWDVVTNKQAEKTQTWQLNYFVSISPNLLAGLDLIKKIV